MKVGITLENEKGMDGNVSQHFGQCKYFFIVDIDDDKIVSSEVVVNNATHGGGGCVAVDEILKYKVSHVISGGMGMGAQQKFTQAGVRVYGYCGQVKDAIDELLKEKLGGLGACKDHGQC